jgi:hypothetical protein
MFMTDAGEDRSAAMPETMQLLSVAINSMDNQTLPQPNFNFLVLNITFISRR